MAMSKEDGQKESKNWLKSNLSLHYMKKGFEKFAETQSEKFRQKLLADLEQKHGQGFIEKTCQSCTPATFLQDKMLCRNKLWKQVKCKESICNFWVEVILPNHYVRPAPNIYWDNTNPQKWPTSSWDVAKVFQPHGCQKHASVDEADSSAILAWMHNCVYVHQFLKNISFIKMVQDARNQIMHCSYFHMSELDMQSYIKKMLDLLNDVIQSKNISQEERDALQDAHNKINELLTKDIDFSLEKQLEAAAWKEHMTAMERDILKIKENIPNLNKMGEDFADMKQAQERSTAKMNKLNDELTELSVHLQDGTKVDNLMTLMQELKNEVDNLTAKMDTVQSSGVSINYSGCQINSGPSVTNENSDGSTRNKEVQNLQRYLCELYEQTIPLYPLSSSVMVHVDQIYVKPVMRIVNPDGKPNSKSSTVLQEDTHSFEDIFLDSNESLVKNLYICGDAGVGKTIFCEHLVSVWCHAMEKLEKGDNLTVDEAVMSKYSLLFYISLRESAADGSEPDNDDIKQMIHIQLDTSKYDIEEMLASNRFLIILDGLDEWSPKTRRKSKRFQSKELPKRPLVLNGTIITTSRLWKMETLRAELAGKIDKQINIVGLNDRAKEQLVENVLDILDDKTKLMEQFLDEAIIMDRDLRYILETPILLMQLVCLWYDNGQLASSLCELYGGMIVRQLKITETEKDLPKMTETLILPNETWISKCFSDQKICMKYAKLLKCLGDLAFSAFLCKCRETVLVFDHNQTKIHGMSGSEMEICLRIGLLTQNIVFGKVTEDHKRISFMHKTHQEFFAATHIVGKLQNGSDLNELFDNASMSLELILEMEKVFVFVCGLDARIGEMLMTYVLKVVSKDTRIQTYRKSIEKEREASFKTVLRIQNMILDCCREADMNGHNICLPIHDLSITSDWDLDILARIVLYWNHLDTSHLASLCFIIPSLSENVTDEDLKNIMRSTLGTDCLERLLIFDWGDCVDVNTIYQAVVQSKDTLKSLALLNIQFSLLEDRLYNMLQPLRLEAFGLEGYGPGYGNLMTHQQLPELIDALSQNPDLKRLRLEEFSFVESQFDLRLPSPSNLEELYLDNLYVRNIELDVTNLLVCEIRQLKVNGATRRLVAQLKQATRLQWLVVRGFLEPEDIQTLFEVLPYLTSLKRLVIGDMLFPKLVLGNEIKAVTIPDNCTNLELLEIRSFKFTNLALRKLIDSIQLDNLRVKLGKLTVDSGPASEEDTFSYIQDTEEKFSVFRNDYVTHNENTKPSRDGMWMCFTTTSV